MIQEERGDKIRTKLGKALKPLNRKALLDQGVPLLKDRISCFPTSCSSFFFSSSVSTRKKICSHLLAFDALVELLSWCEQSLSRLSWQADASKCIRDVHHEENDLLSLHEISLSGHELRLISPYEKNIFVYFLYHIIVKSTNCITSMSFHLLY